MAIPGDRTVMIYNKPFSLFLLVTLVVCPLNLPSNLSADSCKIQYCETGLPTCFFSERGSDLLKGLRFSAVGLKMLQEIAHFSKSLEYLWHMNHVSIYILGRKAELAVLTPSTSFSSPILKLLHSPHIFAFGNFEAPKNFVFLYPLLIYDAGACQLNNTHISPCFFMVGSQ